MDKKLGAILNELWALKYRNIKAYNVDGSGVSRFLVVGTAITIAENKKLAYMLAQELKYGDKIDGFHKGEWIIFDLDEIVVHLFASGHREKYNLDKLYKGKEINISKEDKKIKNEAKRKNKV